MLRELYESIYESHVARTSLALKALWNGYFWPTLKANALDLVKRCDKWKRYTHVPRKPFVEQLPLMVTWSFDQWGINLLIPFLTTLDS